MDFLCRKVFILFLICKITDFASHKRETYYFLLFLSAIDQARLRNNRAGTRSDWVLGWCHYFQSFLCLKSERESRSKYFCFRISIFSEISFNSADAAQAKQARPILLKCQSFFFARRKTTKKKQNILRHILVYWKAARSAKTLSSKLEWFICFRPRIPPGPSPECRRSNIK